MRVQSSTWRGPAVGLGLLLACATVSPAAADLPGEVLAPLAGARAPTGAPTEQGPGPHAAPPGSQPNLAPAAAPPRRSVAARQGDFPKSPALVPRVEFWKRIYSEVGTDGGLLHDTQDLGVVYEVVRLPDDASRLTQERFLRQRREHYQAILRKLAKSKRGLDADARRVLSLFPDGVSSATLQAAAGRVRFQLGQADKFRDGLIRQGRWQQYMRGVFAERGMPVELASLPHVESSFNPQARSHVGASGLWQFTRPTGRMYMRVDYSIDERNDPWIATVGAARLLRDNYKTTRSWPLALTGYNHGVGGMERAVRQLGTRDMATIIERYQGRSFGFASKNFYTEFLAALEVEENAERYFGRLAHDPPQRPEMAELDAYYKPSTLASAFGISLDALKESNPALLAGIWSGQRLIPKGYALRVPRNPLRAGPEVVLASIPSSERHGQQLRQAEYRVQRGDTLSRIAARFGVRTKDLMTANGLRSANRIYVGQKLEIPGSARRVASVSSSGPTAAAGGTYRVRAGDTLGRIAERHGVSESALAKHNGIRDRSLVKIGQKLRIPGGGSRASASGGVYEVRRGDTLDSIARRHGTTVKSIAALNGLRNRHQIKAGQRLVLPGS